MGKNSVLLFVGYNDSKNNHTKKLRPEKEVAREIISLLYDTLGIEKTIIFLNKFCCSLFPECINGSKEEKERWIKEQLFNF